MKRSVAITGIGIVSPAGVGKESYWESIRCGIPRISMIQNPTSKYIGGQITNFHPSGPIERHILRFVRKDSLFLLEAVRLAMEDSFLNLAKEDPGMIGACFGSFLGPISHAAIDIENYMSNAGYINPFMAVSNFMGNVTGIISILFKIQGRCTYVSTLEASSADAIGYAFESIQHGKSDIMLAGGTEAPLGHLTIKAFETLGTLSKRNNTPEKASRPFDRERDGFVLAEGAAVLVLEELMHAINRDAHIYAIISGFETVSSKKPLVPIPHITIKNQFNDVITLAFSKSGVKAEEIDYISAFGTSHPTSDRIETLLLKKVFGKRAYQIPVSSIMSMVGHSLGAAGAMQAVTCALVLEHQILPPTINYEYPDPECDLDYVPNQARKAKVDAILQNTISLWGRNVVLIYKRLKGKL